MHGSSTYSARDSTKATGQPRSWTGRDATGLCTGWFEEFIRVGMESRVLSCDRLEDMHVIHGFTCTTRVKKLPRITSIMSSSAARPGVWGLAPMKERNVVTLRWPSGGHCRGGRSSSRIFRPMPLLPLKEKKKSEVRQSLSRRGNLQEIRWDEVPARSIRSHRYFGSRYF